MPADTRYPTKAIQTSAGHYRVFSNVTNVCNSSTEKYAESKYPVQKKSDTYNRPSTITVNDFKFNAPANSRIKKITVEYRFRKLGTCKTSNNSEYPCTSNKKVCNVGAPTITLLNAGGNFSAKGQAPTGDMNYYSKSFDCDIPAATINSSNFSVKFDLPKNTNNYTGYIRIRYIRVKIEYVTQNYGINLTKISGGYNQEEFVLGATISNLNNTDGNPNVTITTPLGFSYTGFNGNGSIRSIDARTFVWTPTLGHGVGSSNVQLKFMPNVTYSPGSTSYPYTFVAGISGFGSGNHSGTITEAPIPPSSETGDAETSFESDTQQITIPPALVTEDEEFEYTLKIDDITWSNMQHTLYENGPLYEVVTFEEYVTDYFPYEYVYFAGELAETPQKFSKNEYLTWKRFDNTWQSGYYRTQIIDMEDKSITLTMKGGTIGYDEIYLFAQYLDLSTSTAEFIEICTWKFVIRPPEEDLTVPFFSVLTPTDEELKRLGDDYGYTVQSYLKEVTSETYVRDWYKNFRIGVFNNAIAANQTRYIQVDSTDDSQKLDIVLPTLYDLSNVVVSVDHPVDLVNPDETTETISTSKTFDLEENILSMDLLKKNHNNIVLTININVDNASVYSTVYHVNFNQESQSGPTEIITDSTDYTNLTDAQIFSNAEYWSNAPSTVNTYENLTCPFIYNENYPLYILFVGDYDEADTNISSIKYTEPCIIESTIYEGALPNGNYPVSIDDMVLNDGSTSEITLENYTTGTPFILYDLELPDAYGTNSEIAITGIQLSGNMEHSDNLILYAKLKSPTGEIGQRSLIIDDTDSEFSIGGNGDLWGFTTLDMVNLEDWELELELSNLLNDYQSSLNFGDLKFTIYYEFISPQDHHVLFEGEDIAYYNAIIKDIKIPQGIETETDLLNVKGTDTNKPYSQNIREKTIELELEVGDSCDLEANTQTLRQLAKLIVTEKDEYNKPIPKRVEFSHLPDVYAEYITKEGIDNDIILGGYENIKIKLTIPSGTFYSKERIQTNNIGYIQGVANVNPLIRIRATGNELQLLEVNSQQKFNMNIPDTYKNTGIIEIDCENRICRWYENDDALESEVITQYVDFNSSWFTLKNEYNFNATNCVLLIVDYAERW